MIDKLEMLIALAQTRHFGHAAERLGIAQPTLSAGIRRLEADLGVMLVKRGSRYGGLTPEGVRVLEWARQIVGDARTMREELRTARMGLSGVLRLAVIPTALTVASQLTRRFAMAHRNLRISVMSSNSIDILKALEGLQVDAGISYLDNEPLGRVITVPLYRESYVLLVRHDAREAAKPSVRWAELGGVRLCLLSADMQNRRIIGGHLAEAGIAVSPAIESNSTIVLARHVAEGGWATILPAKAAEVFLDDGHLVAVPITEPDARHAVGLIAPWREPHTPVIAALLAEARQMSEA